MSDPKNCVAETQKPLMAKKIPNDPIRTRIMWNVPMFSNIPTPVVEGCKSKKDQTILYQFWMISSNTWIMRPRRDRSLQDQYRLRVSFRSSASSELIATCSAFSILARKARRGFALWGRLLKFVVRPRRESNSRIAVLQTAELPLFYVARETQEIRKKRLEIGKICDFLISNY